MDEKMQLREKVISLLENKGSLYLGDIIKEISVSPKSGYKFVKELEEEGILKLKENSLKITLA